MSGWVFNLFDNYVGFSTLRELIKMVMISDGAV